MKYSIILGHFIEYSFLEPGIYSVQEFDPPTGYVLNDYEFHVALFPGRTSQLVVNNVKKPDLCIIKTDANTGLPIEGVTYTVRKVDSSTVSTVKTDKNGEAWLYALDPGVYQVTEQSVPPGYLLDPNPQLITLFGGRVGVVRFQNHPRPKLRILKVDVVTGEPLKNAEFRISKVEGLTVSEYITDETGVILIENLDEAIYEVTEFMPPDGYVRYDESKQIQLEPGKTKTLKFDNIRKPTLIVTKTNGLTFKPIPNTTFKIEYEDASGGVHTLGAYRTDANGQIVLPHVNPGWYIITETIPAPGFSLSSNPVTRKYLAPGENAYTNREAGGTGGDVSGDNITVTSGHDYILGHEIIDYPLNSIVIRKVDANTGKLLAGAAFELRQVSEDISGSSGTLIGRYTTDNSGTIVITGLKPGGFIVTEVGAPTNYLLSENAQQQVWLRPDGTSIVETTFANFPYGGILITKVDAQTNKPLANARFRVTDSSGAVVGNTGGEYITDENGEILIPDVKPGSYVITEIEAPAFYSIDTTPQTVKVGLDGGIYKVSFKNQPAGAIVIRKLDYTTKEPLAGAEFKVTDSTGAVVGTGNGIFHTDAAGTIKITGLSRGSYVIEEITAPTGYILENNTQTVAVDYGKTYTIDIYNKKMSGAQIIKIDADSKQPLKGARFTVYRMDGGVIGTYETNGDGVIILDALESGWYKAAESKAPDGYLIDDTPQDFHVTSNQFIKLTFENKRLASIQIKKVDAFTGAPLAGAVFEVRQQNGAFVGEFTTDRSGSISMPAAAPGWFVIKELKAPPGYILSGAAKTVEVKATVPTVVTFTNTPIGGLKIVKLDEDTRNVLKGASFEVRRMNGELIGTYTTNASGIIALPDIGNGWFTVAEVKPPEGYRLDSEPRNIEVKDGKTATLEITNKKTASLMITKTDSVTGKGIYGVTFILYDAGKNPIRQLITDQNGIACADKDLTAGKYFLREFEAAEGYEADTDWKTIYVEAGKTTHVAWKNKPITAQIQIVKYSSDSNSVTGAPAGSLLKGAVFEITRARSGVVVGYITTDARGYAASEPLPLGRYLIKEVTAPQYYQLSGEQMEAEPLYPGQIIRLSAYNKSVNLGTEIKKAGNIEVVAGDSMRYDISLRNTSNVPLSNFYWSDRLPTDAARAQTLTTGTYNQRLYYRVMYKTNGGGWRTLASNLLSTNHYSFNLSAAALGLMNGEVVTDIKLEFGTVAAGFASVTKPTATVQTLPTLANGYQIINRCEVGGQYGSAPQISQAAWVTKVVRYGPTPSLPKTGY